MRKKLKVLVVTGNKGFCFFYRAKWPLAALYEQDLVDVMAIDADKASPELFGSSADWADVLLFQYATPSKIVERYAMYIQENRLPKLIVGDFDDDYTNIHPSNPAYKHFGLRNVKVKGGRHAWKNKTNLGLAGGGDSHTFDIDRNRQKLEDMLRAVVCCDVVTVTNKTLANVYSKNPNVFVLPNYINPSAMPDRPERTRRDKVVIGWQGGDSHYDDLRSIMPVLKEIKGVYKDKVEFRFFGAHFKKMFREIGAEFVPWVGPDRFYEVFANKLFDIGVIPLLDTPFNRSKSNIKWLEYSYYKIPSVVANVSPYKEGITHGVNGLLYDTHEDASRYLRMLIDDSLYRTKIGADAHKHVVAKYDIKRQVYQWHDLYSYALEEKVKMYAAK